MTLAFCHLSVIIPSRHLLRKTLRDFSKAYPLNYWIIVILFALGSYYFCLFQSFCTFRIFSVQELDLTLNKVSLYWSASLGVLLLCFISDIVSVCNLFPFFLVWIVVVICCAYWFAFDFSTFQLVPVCYSVLFDICPHVFPVHGAYVLKFYLLLLEGIF